MRHRRLLLACLALGLALFPALPAAAADDPNVGQLVYSGTRTIADETQDLSVDIDCAGGVCTIDGFASEVVITDGVFIADHPGSVGTCDRVDPGFSGRLDLTPESITGTIVYEDYQVDCEGLSTSPGFLST